MIYKITMKEGITNMNTIECIKTRRSVRKFQEAKPSHDLLEQIIESATFAPSWKNAQITRYIAIEDESLKAQVAELTNSYNKNYVLSAPVLIAVTMIKNRSGFERDGSFSTIKGSGWQMFDCGLASQTFCLAAHELGLATVILGIFKEEEITRLLEIPEDRELVCLIPLGYADETPIAPKRKSVSDLIEFR